MNVLPFHVKCLNLLSDINQFWSLLTDFRKSPLTSNIMKILPVGTALIRADRQTDGQT
jgi:hypothetical protein